MAIYIIEYNNIELVYELSMFNKINLTRNYIKFIRLSIKYIIIGEILYQLHYMQIWYSINIISHK